MKTTIQARINIKDMERLIETAESQGHTISSFVRYIIKLYLKERYEEKEKEIDL